MQKVFRQFMNIFVALTLASFIVSAVPVSALASNSKADSTVIHIADSQKGEPAHQKDGQCDDGCCISHCFCAGYAIPAFQTFYVPIVGSLATVISFDQKAEDSPSAPQLRPPRILA